MRIQGFRASLGVRGLLFSVQGSLTKFLGLMNHPQAEGNDARDPSVNVRSRREIHVLRSDLPRIEEVSVGAVLRSVVLDTAFLVTGVRAPGESPVVIVECEESA